MSKKVYKLLLLFILCGTFVSAQNISVTSFKLLENDLTANTAGTMERDQNGEVAALIKVVTTEQGFVFDGGMVGVTKTKQMTGAAWYQENLHYARQTGCASRLLFPDRHRKGTHV